MKLFRLGSMTTSSKVAVKRKKNILVYCSFQHDSSLLKKKIPPNQKLSGVLWINPNADFVSTRAVLDSTPDFLECSSPFQQFFLLSRRCPLIWRFPQWWAGALWAATSDEGVARDQRRRPSCPSQNGLPWTSDICAVCRIRGPSHPPSSCFP